MRASNVTVYLLWMFAQLGQINTAMESPSAFSYLKSCFIVSPYSFFKLLIINSTISHYMCLTKHSVMIMRKPIKTPKGYGMTFCKVETVIYTGLLWVTIIENRNDKVLGHISNFHHLLRTSSVVSRFYIYCYIPFIHMNFTCLHY